MINDLKEIREALEFFGNLQNYLADIKDTNKPYFDFRNTPIQRKGYDKAHEALTKLDEMIKKLEKADADIS